AINLKSAHACIYRKKGGCAFYDPAVTPTTFALTLRKSDFRRIVEIRDPERLAALLRMACRVSRRVGSSLQYAFQTSVVRGKHINHVTDFPVELLIRKINANLRYLTRHRHSSRD